jgi:uncharacterized protein (TIGR02453 family)
METIKKATLNFLSELRDNNYQEWFKVNYGSYSDAKKNFETLVQQIIYKTVEFEPILKGLEVRNSVFRINRDIRFSKDKSPYKSNFGAFIVRGGKKNGDKFAGYYLHIEPGNNSFIAGGAYMPPSSWLAAIREKIDQEPEKIKEIINHSDFIKYFRQIEGEKLKNPPKGYTSENPNIDLLKFKSYLAMNELTDKFVLSEEYPKHVLAVFKAMKPFNDFLNDY